MTGFMKGYRLIGVYLLVVLAFICWLCSCKSIKYVPVEIIKKEQVHTTDTVRQTDTTRVETNTIIREARPEDSVMLAKLGIKLQSNERMLIMLQQELSEARSEIEHSHSKDSVRVDSVEVPYPVERKLSRWEEFCLDYGKVTTGGTIVCLFMIVAYLVRRLKKPKK